MRWVLCKIPLHRATRSFGVVCPVRTLRLKGSPDCKEEENSTPLPFSTSKASHRQWTVEKSMGSEDSKPLWKAMAVSLVFGSILIWAIFRKETDIDEIIYKPLGETDGEENKSESVTKK
ncbi:ubiquinol-cytochrome c reductase complex assembly factor 4 [Pelodytes ibericus]